MSNSNLIFHWVDYPFGLQLIPAIRQIQTYPSTVFSRIEIKAKSNRPIVIIIYCHKISYEKHRPTHHPRPHSQPNSMQKISREVNASTLGTQSSILAAFGSQLGSLLRGTSQTQRTNQRHRLSGPLWVVHRSSCLHDVFSGRTSTRILLILYSQLQLRLLTENMNYEHFLQIYKTWFTKRKYSIFNLLWLGDLILEPSTCYGLIRNKNSIRNESFRLVLLNFIIMPRDSRTSGQGKDKLNSTRGSFFNRTVGRDTKPAWGNRIVKDFYDLDYDTSRFSFSNPQRFKNKQLQQKQKLKADLVKRTNEYKKKVSISKQQRNSLSKRENTKSNDRIMSLQVQEPQRIEIVTINTAPSGQCGLSPFEYQNTIEGRIQNRTSHHLSFQKDKLQRILNENPIYYDRNKDLDFSYSRLMTQRHKLRKYHPFASYKDRKVFEPREELDKFYNTKTARKIVSPTKIQQTVLNFEKVLSRKQARLEQSARLTYDITGCLQFISRTQQNYSLQMTPRETILGAEVINPKRGCRR